MDSVYVFLIRNDVWIYILCGMGLVWYLFELFRAQRMLRSAMFGLEWETGYRLRNSALSLVIVLSLVVGLVTYVNREIAPTLPPELLRPPTPTPNLFAMPLSSPTPLGSPAPAEPSPTPPLVPTVTLRSNAVPGLAQETPETPEAAENDAVASAPDNCLPSITITEPASGSAISGNVTFAGSASVPNFAFYKLEINGPQTGGLWASILGRTVDLAVQNDVLGTANFGGWAAGLYRVRLAVVDGTSNEVGECVIQLNLEES